MKTSAAQFEIMVSYMESHGDLSRPTDAPNGRINNMRHWAELVTMLNADASGEQKSEEKWRKTWSDLKNNTKRKAARISKAVSGTGGGPASKIKLTDLEERVLAIMNPQAATGITGVTEVGLENSQPVVVVVEVGDGEEATNSIERFEDWNMAGSSSQPPVFPSISPPAQPEPEQHQTPPAATPRTPRRHRSGTLTAGPSPKRKRLGNLTQSELARQTFVNSDREWRKFQMEKFNKEYELEKERLRLREVELQQQLSWQQLFAQLLLVLEKISNSLNRDK